MDHCQGLSLINACNVLCFKPNHNQSVPRSEVGINIDNVSAQGTSGSSVQKKRKDEAMHVHVPKGKASVEGGGGQSSKGKLSKGKGGDGQSSKGKPHSEIVKKKRKSNESMQQAHGPKGNAMSPVHNPTGKTLPRYKGKASVEGQSGQSSEGHEGKVDQSSEGHEGKVDQSSEGHEGKVDQSSEGHEGKVDQIQFTVLLMLTSATNPTPMLLMLPLLQQLLQNVRVLALPIPNTILQRNTILLLML
jgi:hypothetical protein